MTTLTKSEPKQKAAGTTMRPGALRRASIVANFLNVPVIDFISESSDLRAAEIIKQNKIKLPDDAAFANS